MTLEGYLNDKDWAATKDLSDRLSKALEVIDAEILLVCRGEGLTVYGELSYVMNNERKPN